jgi:hypothetical protein
MVDYIDRSPASCRSHQEDVELADYLLSRGYRRNPEDDVMHAAIREDA